jgi:hypothetical protein
MATSWVSLLFGYKCERGRLEVRVPEGRSAVLACR